MVQFKGRAGAAPGLGGARLEELARSAVQRVLEEDGSYTLRGGALVPGPSGSPVYVVVVERAEELLPTRAEVQRRWKLTQREAAVALLVARRLEVDEMAASLGVTVYTVRRHIERVLEKLRLERRREVRGALLALAERERRAAEREARFEVARRARRLQTAA